MEARKDILEEGTAQAKAESRTKPTLQGSGP